MIGLGPNIVINNIIFQRFIQPKIKLNMASACNVQSFVYTTKELEYILMKTIKKKRKGNVS